MCHDQVSEPLCCSFPEASDFSVEAGSLIMLSLSDALKGGLRQSCS